MTDTQEHHFAPIRGGEGQRVLNRVLAETGIDLRTAAINIQQFPAAVADAADVQTPFRHNGKHLNSYSNRVLKTIEAILQNPSPAGSAADVDHFLAAVRVAVNGGDLIPNNVGGVDADAVNSNWFDGDWRAYKSEAVTELQDTVRRLSPVKMVTRTNYENSSLTARTKRVQARREVRHAQKRSDCYPRNAAPCDPTRQSPADNFFWRGRLPSLPSDCAGRVREARSRMLGLLSDAKPCSLDRNPTKCRCSRGRDRRSALALFI